MAAQNKRSVAASAKVQPTSLRQTHKRSAPPSNPVKKSVDKSARVSQEAIKKAAAKTAKTNARNSAKTDVTAQKEAAAKAQVRAKASSPTKTRASQKEAPRFRAIKGDKEFDIRDWYAEESKATKAASTTKATKATKVTKATEATEAAEATEEEIQEPRKKTLSQKLAAMKHARTKERASKEFTKKYEGKTPATGDGGPRAAVYKGQMGKKQKKAQELQGSKSSGHAFAIGDTIARTVRSTRFIVSMGVVACFIALSLFLYPAAQNYYKALRENERLAAEYAAVEKANSQLEAQLEYLQSDAGVEQKAREQYGWVKAGENAVVVYGLNQETNDDSSVVTAVVSGSIKAPETWYSPFLDALFGVES